MPVDVTDAPTREREMDEAALVELAKARSQEAWALIYDEHYPYVYRYVHARVFDPDTAADITAGVFVAAIKGIRSYKHTGRPLLAWLYVIARNQVADHQREAVRARGISGVGSPVRAVRRMFSRGREEAEEPAAPGPLETDTADDRMDLQRAIAALPDSQREVLVLRFLVGLSADEIASVIGKERSAVYSLHARAVATLREKLSDDWKPE